MFGRKKQSQKPADDAEAQAYIQHLLVEVPRILYTGVVGNQAGSELSVLLELDKAQGVEHIKNLTVNGMPKIPSGDVVEALNRLTMPVASLPTKHHIASLEITITKDGQFNTNTNYRNN